RQRLTGMRANVQWLDALPHNFKGCVIANEVLDAMPATLFRWNEAGELMEMGVRLDEPGTPRTESAQPVFVLDERPANDALQALVAQRVPPLPGYRSEINIQAEAWVRQLGTWLKKEERRVGKERTARG